MSRRLLGMGLLLSVGVNLGILVMVFLRTEPPNGPPTVGESRAPGPEASRVPVEPPPERPVIEPAVSEPAAPPANLVEPPPTERLVHWDPPPHDPPPVEPPPEDPAPEPRDGPPPGPGRNPTRPFDQNPGVALRLDRLADELGLVGEPRERFNEIQRGFLRSAWELRGTLRNAEAEMRQELFARQPDRARLALIQERVEGARRQMEALMVDTVLRSRELLDPAQEVAYMQVIARLRQAALSGPPREGQLRRQPPGRQRPLNRRPGDRRFPHRPPG